MLSSPLVTVCCFILFTNAQIPDPADSLFTNSPGSDVRWKDCDSGTSWIHMNRFGWTPYQLHVPGPAHLTFHAFSTHDVDQRLSLYVLVYKRLSDSWAHVPCTEDFGSCYYDDICQFLQHFFPGGNCPGMLHAQGLPCGCPFSIPGGKVVNINNEPIDVVQVKAAYTWLTTGEYYIKFVASETGTTIERMCLEMFASVSVGPHLPAATTATTQTKAMADTLTAIPVTTTPGSATAISHIITTPHQVPSCPHFGRKRQVPDRTGSTFMRGPNSNISWRDCGGFDSWVHFDEVSVDPFSIHLPGPVNITIRAYTTHVVPQSLTLIVEIRKHLLSRFTNVPCTMDLGSCTYSDPCHFMQVFFPDGNCPQWMHENHLPCTCPFRIEECQIVYVNSLQFYLPRAKPEYTWLSTGEYYVKLNLYETGMTTSRMCLEYFVYLNKN